MYKKTVKYFVQYNKVHNIKKEMDNILNVIRRLEKTNFDGINDSEINVMYQLLLENSSVCISEARRFFNAVEYVGDERMRLILCLRYINGLGWKQIAFTIGDMSADEVKAMHDLFVKEL